MTNEEENESPKIISETKPTPETTATDVLSFYNELESLDIKIWIDGGWAVDALLGEQTRPHKDLDIAIQAKDVSKMRELLETKGYKEINLEEARPHNFVLADEKGRQIDIHVIVLDEKGNGIYGPIENEEMYSAQGLTGQGTIDGQTVQCVSPEIMVEFLAPWIHKWPEKYVTAVYALCKKYIIELPKEYTHFIQENPDWQP